MNESGLSLAVAYPCTKLARNLKVEHADQSFNAKAHFFFGRRTAFMNYYHPSETYPFPFAKACRLICT